MRVAERLHSPAEEETMALHFVPMFHSRRRVLQAALVASASLGAGFSSASEYPDRPIRLIVPVAPGGPADLAARALAQRLREELGQPVIVDNRPGAAGVLGSTQVLQAAPDGYTLLLSLPSAQITAPLLMESPPYDGASQFTAIGQFARFTAVLLIGASVPAKTFAELVHYARQKPGALNYGSTGIGSQPHLMSELLCARAGVRLVHVPYKGGAPALQALVFNEVQVLFGEISTALPWIQSGRVKALAVVSERRTPLLTDVPTLSEAGMADAPSNPWMGLAGPPQLPRPVVKRLSEAVVKAAQHPDVQQFFAKGGGEAFASSPEALKALWAEEQRRWADVIKSNKIRAS